MRQKWVLRWEECGKDYGEGIFPEPLHSPGKERAHGASLAAQMVKNLSTMQETQVRSLDQKDLPGEGNGYPLQHSYLENSMDRGAWWTITHGVAKSWPPDGKSQLIGKAPSAGKD